VSPVAIDVPVPRKYPVLTRAPGFSRSIVESGARSEMTDTPGA
jgi:hypothetical protein